MSSTKAGPREAQWQPCPTDSTHMAEWYPYDKDFPDGWFVHCRRCGTEGYRRAEFKGREKVMEPNGDS